jgi:hypothetical protein
VAGAVIHFTILSIDIFASFFLDRQLPLIVFPAFNQLSFFTRSLLVGCDEPSRFSKKVWTLVRDIVLRYY